MRLEQHFSESELEQGARRILHVMGLPESLLAAAAAAVAAEADRTRLSMDGIVQQITTEAMQAYRRGISNEKFLEDFLAQKWARQVLEILNLSDTPSHISRLAVVLKAEAKDKRQNLQETAQQITHAASEDRQRGKAINIFYFEDFKWRSNARISKAEQRKLDNLAANARAREILRGQFR